MSDDHSVFPPRPAARPAPAVGKDERAAPAFAGGLGRRALVLLSAAGVVFVLAVAAAGALIGHEVWSTSTAPPSSGVFGDPGSSGGSGAFGNAGGGGSGAFGNAGGSGTAGSSPGAVAAKVNDALVDVDVALGYQQSAGAGTGIVVGSNGLVLTNNHVIDGATRITATDVGNGRTYAAKVLGYDPSHDLALLQLQGASGLKTAKLGDSSKATVGEPVVGIGNAGGQGGIPSSAAGKITALNATITAADELGQARERLSGLIQTNADIQPGDSGGPLVDSSGTVLGINTAGSRGFAFELGGTRAYAIPSNQAIATLKTIQSGHGNGTVHIGATAFLGIGIAPRGSGFGAYGGGGYGIGGGTNVSGAVVGNVLQGEPAARAGLAAGDVITSLGGQAIDSSTKLSSAMLAHHPGDTVTVEWTDAGGDTHSASLKLATGPPA